jgi:elongation factor G
MAPAPLSLDITPKTPAEQQKLARALQVIAAEDDEIEVRSGAEPGCTVIGATSEGRLEEIIDRLKREFEVEASVGRPTVVYLETLTRSADGSAKHVRMVHGQGEYAHVALRLHAGEPGSGYSFKDATIGGSIPKSFMPSIDRGVREAMAAGVLSGYPIVDVRVEVHDGSYHDTDSTDRAFRTAAAMAFQDAARKAEPLVLEPVMEVVVRADNRHVKTVLEDLLIRRGDIETQRHEQHQEVITAHVRLSELFGFEGQLRAATHGHASCSIGFAYYQPVVHGSAGDDDRISRVGAPRRPAPNLRSSAASVPEPNDSSTEEA